MRRLSAALLLLPLTLAAAQAESILIVAFGDSATYGYLVPREQAYPAQLQAMLRARGHDVVVHNEGVNGDTTANALRRLDRAIAPETRIAIVELGTNDLRMRVPVATIEARLTEIVRTLKARRIQAMIVGLGRLNLSGVANANGVPYAQWTLPPGRYRARDGAHFNAEGYRIVVERMLPTVEALLARAGERR